MPQTIPAGCRMTAAVPVLPVRETLAAAQFYADKLGFEIGYADEAYAILDRDGIEIHLWPATDESWRTRGEADPVVSGAETFLAGTSSCRVRVEEIDALCETYRAAGVLHPNGPLADKPYGLREFAVLDLDGNLITFYQRIPD